VNAARSSLETLESEYLFNECGILFNNILKISALTDQTDILSVTLVVTELVLSLEWTYSRTLTV
jgi:hypothetical protein